MGDPWGVCVVPAASDPGGLLVVRRLPPVPPASVLRWSSASSGRPPEVTGWDPASPLWPSALPLWWAGKLVPEGWDRFVRAVLAAAGGGDDRPVSRFPSLDEVLGAAPVAVQAGLVSRVVLLDLVDGRLVERAP